MNFFVKTLSFIFLSLMLNVQAVQAQRFEWVEQIGGVSLNLNSTQIVKSIQDDSGNYFVGVNYISSTNLFGTIINAPNQGFYIAKLDPSRNPLWVTNVTVPFQSTNTLIDFDVDSLGNIYFHSISPGIILINNQSILSIQTPFDNNILGKINFAGQGIFAKIINPTTYVDFRSRTLKISPDGSIYIIGLELDIVNSVFVNFIQKRNSSGTQIFSKIQSITPNTGTEIGIMNDLVFDNANNPQVLFSAFSDNLSRQVNGLTLLEKILFI